MIGDPMTEADPYQYKPYACLSVYGLETPLKNTVCSWQHPAGYYIEKAHQLGFNTIRIPLSIQYIVENDLKVLNEMVASCQKFDVRFFLDFHRVNNARQQESWDVGIRESTLVHSRQEVREAMMSVVKKFEKVPQFVGMNSWNEYAGTNVTFKTEWDQYIFDEVERLFPARFTYFPTGVLWGGDLAGYSLENLPYAKRIIYSVHKYHFSGTGTREDWERSFGTRYPPFKLFVEEYGFRDPEDLDWGEGFVDYLVEKDIRNHCFWTVAHSGDTGGLWKDDCETLDTKKLEIVQPLLSP
jgi:hypothetical protein